MKWSIDYGNNPDDFLKDDQEEEMEMDRMREHEMASKAVNDITKTRVPRNRTDTLQSQIKNHRRKDTIKVSQEHSKNPIQINSIILIRLCVCRLLEHLALRLRCSSFS